MPCLMLSMRVKHLPVPLLSLEATWGRSFIGALGWILRVLMCGTEFVRNQVGRLGIKMRTLCREDPPLDFKIVTKCVLDKIDCVVVT
jgi:hypothetical protein